MNIDMNTLEIDWHKATLDNIELYKEILDIELDKIFIPETVKNCSDFLCSRHNNEILILFNEINEAINNASKIALPKRNKNTGKGIIPGWNEYIRPFKDQSIYYTKLWNETVVQKAMT